ncbi:sensor histidine kinase [Lysinibacillus xylanilyticus]|uniref:histidine kinase n=1 Tax=Lysinibacillus xylanilyticus TaxID=582475 RepID=A0ABT4EQ99_9BACI|nr:HAMP domain-containing sensor histidine kinase [Lysinibacillus xylanilyticus]MCY9547173.1 HAMP domain-containing histidine kinase [Lysinibacillus xylanilyticus]
MKQKIGTKLTIYITLVVIITFSISLAVSQFFLPKYYLHQLNQKVTNAFSVYQEFEDKSLVEDQFDVTILSVSLEDNINVLNENLIQQLAREHIALNRFWVSEEVLQKVNEDKIVGKVYNQGKQKSSFIAHYSKDDNQLIMIGASMGNFIEIANFINRFNIFFLIVSILLIIIITALLSRKLTRPLNELKKVAKEIGELDFKQAEIRTGDEIEDLARSINKMSKALDKAQQDLSKRNIDLKQFMIGLTHELKTPLALVRVYSSGIEDGMDDGTYLATINKQVDRMEKIIIDMLYFAKTEENDSNKTTFDLIMLINEILNNYRHIQGEKQIYFKTEVTEYILTAEQDKVHFIFENMISNAVKYASGNEIHIYFGQDSIFEISNDTTLTDISRIWHPFYVGESSRDKNFSGTGLGLATVKSLAEQLGYSVQARLSNGKINFKISFVNSTLR